MTQPEKLIRCQIYRLTTLSHKPARCRACQKQADCVLKSAGRGWMKFFFFRSSLQNFPKSFYYVLSSHVNHSTEINKTRKKAS